MEPKERFSNVFDYAYCVERTVNENLPLGPLEYTFASDFAIADWYGEEDVKDTYKRVKEDWLCDYKAFTEVVIALNSLAWISYAADRPAFTDLYSDLYYKAKEDFYDKWGDDADACEWFYKMTD